jgi:hypothetical protein
MQADVRRASASARVPAKPATETTIAIAAMTIRRRRARASPLESASMSSAIVGQRSRGVGASPRSSTRRSHDGTRVDPGAFTTPRTIAAVIASSSMLANGCSR